MAENYRIGNVKNTLWECRTLKQDKLPLQCILSEIKSYVLLIYNKSFILCVNDKTTKTAMSIMMFTCVLDGSVGRRWTLWLGDPGNRSDKLH